MHIRLLFAWGIAALFAAWPCAAQEQSDSSAIGLQKGSWSLQFQVMPNATLGSFDGAVLAGKKHLSDHSALRFQINFDLIDVYQNFDRITRTEDPDEFRDDFDLLGLTNEAKSWEAQFSLLYLRYVQPAPSLGIYMGAGPGFAIDVFDISRANIHRQLRNDVEQFAELYSTETRDFWGIGATVMVGAEWFVTPHISFIAEYETEVFYRFFETYSEFESNETRRIRRGTQDEVTKSFSLNDRPVKFGVSVYF